MRTFGQFPCSNQRANYFLKETCGFSGDVSESAADCRGRKNASGGKRRIPDRRKLPGAARNFRGMGVGLKPDWSAGWLSVEARCFKVAGSSFGPRTGLQACPLRRAQCWHCDPCRARCGEYAAAATRACRMRHETLATPASPQRKLGLMVASRGTTPWGDLRWIPACAGMTILGLTAFERVVPAQAGTQRLLDFSLITEIFPLNGLALGAGRDPVSFDVHTRLPRS